MPKKVKDIAIAKDGTVYVIFEDELTRVYEFVSKERLEEYSKESDEQQIHD